LQINGILQSKKKYIYKGRFFVDEQFIINDNLAAGVTILLAAAARLSIYLYITETTAIIKW
jgi:hypothetical protein